MSRSGEEDTARCDVFPFSCLSIFHERCGPNPGRRDKRVAHSVALYRNILVATIAKAVRLRAIEGRLREVVNYQFLILSQFFSSSQSILNPDLNPVLNHESYRKTIFPQRMQVKFGYLRLEKIGSDTF